MERWNWFLAADMQGKWITTNGCAEVTPAADGFHASLRITPDTPVYHEITAQVHAENRVEAQVASPGRDTPSFELFGQLFEGPEVDGIPTRTVLLADGATVIGLCYGPRSHEKNL
jgi:hypothetical protein